jgi:tRNA(Ile)-lysidine synthase
VRAGGLLWGGRPVVAMLSGGRDSVCLLDVCVALCGAGAVSALHVNYGLRASAERDERHCAALCGQLGVKLSIVRAERPAGEPAAAERSDPPAGNLQAWARELRYERARLLAEPRGAAVAAGHTASDQVETVLYRLAASPGRRALLGMAAAEGGLIRPLLGHTREQTAAYCRARGLDWCEDESNEDRRFARVRVRHEVLPALRTVHPAAESNVLRTAQLLREETELLDALVEAELSGGPRIALARLGELPAALARMIVVRLAEQASGAYVPQAGERVEELLALGARGGTAELHLGGGAGAVIERGVLRMRLLAAEESSARGRDQPPPRPREPLDARPRQAPPGED